MKVQHTILEFTKVQFLGNWERQVTGTAVIYYPAEKPKLPNLKVVWQSETGTEITYDFIVPYKDRSEQGDYNQVFISWGENIIHIPALCLKGAKGDKATCKG